MKEEKYGTVLSLKGSFCDRNILEYHCIAFQILTDPSQKTWKLKNMSRSWSPRQACFQALLELYFLAVMTTPLERYHMVPMVLFTLPILKVKVCLENGPLLSYHIARVISQERQHGNGHDQKNVCSIHSKVEEHTPQPVCLYIVSAWEACSSYH